MAVPVKTIRKETRYKGWRIVKERVFWDSGKDATFYLVKRPGSTTHSHYSTSSLQKAKAWIDRRVKQDQAAAERGRKNKAAWRASVKRR